jgi:hypothetical protein
MRRIIRLTNGFSKKVENHALVKVLHFTYYNFDRNYKTLCVIPVMQAGLTKKLWSVNELAGLLERI